MRATRDVPHRECDPRANREHEHRQAKKTAGDRRQLRQLQRDASLKRICWTERRTHHRCAGTHGHDGNGIDSETGAQQKQHRHQRNDLFFHVFECAHHGKKDGHERDSEEPARPEKAHQRPDDCGHRP